MASYTEIKWLTRELHNTVIEFNKTLSQVQEYEWSILKMYRPQWPVLTLFVIILYAVSVLSQYLRAANVPLVGRRFVFEPQFITNFRFFRHASEVLNGGYAKVS